MALPGIARFQRAPDSGLLALFLGPQASSVLRTDGLFLGSHASSVLRTPAPVPGIARFQRAPDSSPTRMVHRGPLRKSDRSPSQTVSITAPNFRSTHHRIIVIPFYFDRWSLSQSFEAVGCAHKPCDEGTVMQDAG